MAELIKGRYEIRKQIGEGGMGRTFLAFDQKNRKDVVVKLLQLRKAGEWKTIELFEREAETLKNINHPFIPDYMDYFTLEKGGDTEYYLVQEYIRGKNLEQQVKQGKHFSEDQVFAVAEKLFSILVYLQDRRPPIVHRDINAKNIIVDENDEVYLVDFGAVQSAVKNAVLGGTTVVGTYGYMPMEQMMGKACAASDLYAAGITLIYLLSHTSPQDLPMKKMKVMYKDFVKISPRYCRFLDTLIEPDLAGRLPDAESALALLKKIRQGESVGDDHYAAVIDLHNLLPPFKSRIRFEKNDETVAVIVPGKISGNLPLLLFSLGWLLIIGFWTTMVLQIPGSFSLLFSLFSVPFWLVGFFIIGKVINGFSKAGLTLTPEFVRIKRGVLRPAVTLPLEQVQKIAVKEIQAGRGRRGTYPGQAVNFGVEIEAGAKTVLIDKFLTQSEAQWIVQVVETYKEYYS